MLFVDISITYFFTFDKKKKSYSLVLNLHVFQMPEFKLVGVDILS
jgi:hypothetical protein